MSLRHVSQRGDPFSHPSGSSAQITKKPFCPVFVSFVHIKSFWVFVFSCLSCDGQRAHPATAGPENVQCRSVFIQLIRVVVSSAPVARLPPSNPFLTHGTVESPAKLFSGSSLRSKFKGVRPPPISPEGCAPTPDGCGGRCKTENSCPTRDEPPAHCGSL